MTTIYEEELLPTRRSLLSRLKREGDDASWQEFFDSYWKLIYSVCLRSGLSEDEAQDVVQETFVTLARNLPKFEYSPEKCSFKTWLYKVTQSRIRNYIRNNKRWRENRNPSSAKEGESDTLQRLPDQRELEFGAVWDEEWERNLMSQAMHRVKQKVHPVQYQIFDLYVLKERSVRDVTKLLHVNRAKVYLAKLRISNMIKQEARLLEDRLARENPKTSQG